MTDLSLDPIAAASPAHCFALVELYSNGYPPHCGWQQCLDRVLPPLADEVVVDGRSYRRCLAFLVDEELGPHFIFDDGRGLEEVLLREVDFAAPLSDVARLWIRCYRSWRDSRTHRRRRPERAAA